MGIEHRLASAWFPAILERRALSRRPPGAAVLMYHEVLTDAVDMPNWSVVRESEFRRQVEHLRRNYRVLSMDQLVEALAGTDQRSQATSQRPAVAITFDDGYAGNLEYAAPALEAAGLPYTVYVATAKILEGGLYWYDRVILRLLQHRKGDLEIPTSMGPIRYRPRAFPADKRWAAINQVLTAMKALDGEERDTLAAQLGGDIDSSALRMMTPNEVGTLARHSGATIGSHTHGHELLDAIPIAEVEGSIARSCELIRSWTGQPPVHFSYPNGNHSPGVAEVVSKLGLLSAVTTRNAIAAEGTDPFLIPRIGIGRFDNLNLFRAKVAGVFAGRS